MKCTNCGGPHDHDETRCSWCRHYLPRNAVTYTINVVGYAMSAESVQEAVAKSLVDMRRSPLRIHRG
jgi:hypothetical protein